MIGGSLLQILYFPNYAFNKFCLYNIIKGEEGKTHLLCFFLKMSNHIKKEFESSLGFKVHWLYFILLEKH